MSTPRALPRTSAVLVLLALLLALLPSTPAAAATVSGVHVSGSEARMLALMNNARAAAGLPQLRLASGLTDAARKWSFELARRNQLAHSSLRTYLTPHGAPSTAYLGENVAYSARGVDAMFAAYMASPGHRANILNPRFLYVGIGTVDRKDAATAGFQTEFNTQAFSSGYTTSYGPTRTAAWGLRTEVRLLAPSLPWSFESRDPRVQPWPSTGVRVGAPRWPSFSAADDAVSTTFATNSTSAVGVGELAIRDSVNLRGLTTIRVRLLQRNPAGKPLALRLRLADVRGTTGTQDLPLVTLRPGVAQTFYFTLPSSSRSFKNQISVVVPASSLRSLSTSLASQRADVSVYGIGVS